LGSNIEWDKETVSFSGGAEISCNRTDGRNLVNDYLKIHNNGSNVKYVSNTGELFSMDHDNVDHVLGLFANNHLPYESLRNTQSLGQPSLTEMTEVAIKILNNKKNEKGYVLIVEGGKIGKILYIS
jgi:alkaline phosphatase